MIRKQPNSQQELRGFRFFTLLIFKVFVIDFFTPIRLEEFQHNRKEALYQCVFLVIGQNYITLLLFAHILSSPLPMVLTTFFNALPALNTEIRSPLRSVTISKVPNPPILISSPCIIKMRIVSITASTER